MLSPLDFSTDNFYYLFKSIESLLIFILLIILTIISFSLSKSKTIYWISIFYLVFLIHGLIFFNIGTLDRMRMPLIIGYFFVLLNDINFKNYYISKIDLLKKFK